MASRATRSVGKKPSPRGDDRARQIVEYVVDYVEKAAHFEGAGKNRRLMLGGGMLTFSTGQVTPHMDEMTNSVRAIIDGAGTYRAKRPSEAR